LSKGARAHARKRWRVKVVSATLAGLDLTKEAEYRLLILSPATRFGRSEVGQFGGRGPRSLRRKRPLQSLPELADRLLGKVVLSFGCGYGSKTIAYAKGADHVAGTEPFRIWSRLRKGFG